MKHLCLVLLLCAAVPLAAQNLVQTRLNQYNSVLKACPPSSPCTDAAEAAATLVEALIKFPPPIVATQLLPMPVDTNEGRKIANRVLPDKQQGAPAVGGGATVANTFSVSQLLSGAMESGALQKDTVGTVSTIRANAVGTFRLLTGDCPKNSIQAYPACITEDQSAWRGLSFVFAFDSSRSNQVVPANAGNPQSSVGAVVLRAKQNLSSVGARYEFYKPYDRNSQAFQDAWTTGLSKLADKGAAYGEAVMAGPATVIIPALSDRLPEQLDAALRAEPDETKRMAIAQMVIADYITKKQLSVPLDKWNAFQQARTAYIKNQVDFFNQVLQRRVLAVEFTDQRPLNQQEYGNLTVIAAWTSGKHQETVGTGSNASTVSAPNWNYTLNATADFFYSKQMPGTSTFRDFNAAFQADHKLWRLKALNNPTFTLAAYYQRLANDSVLTFNSDALVPNTTVVLPQAANVILQGTKGNVKLAQAKLTIPFKDSGVSFPIAITWSNRTELLNIPGNDVRGHFGFQFDLDKLTAALQGKPKGQ